LPFPFEQSGRVVKVFKSSFGIDMTLSLVEATGRIKNQKSFPPTHASSSALRYLVDRTCRTRWTETAEQFACEGVDKSELFKISVVIQRPK